MSEFIFGVDLDGVCGDYTGALRRVLAQKRQVSELSLPRAVTWDFKEWGLATREDYLELHAEAVRKRRIFANMDPMEHCAEVLWRLSDAGVWIRLITHRLIGKDGHAIAVADTCTWLDAHDIPYRDICFLGNKPQVEANVYVDDAPHNVEALRAAGNHVVVFDQPYNRGFGGMRAHNWLEVESHVMGLYEQFLKDGLADASSVVS